MASPFNVAATVEIQGLGPILRILRTLPKDLQRKGLRTAMRRGATVVRKAAIAGMQVYDDRDTAEKIYKNVVVQFAPRYSKRIEGVVMRVGVLGGARQYGRTVQNVRKRRVGKTYQTGGDKGNPGGDTWYWRFVEFGVPARGISAKSPMIHALEQNSGRATDIVVSTLDVEISKSLTLLGRA